VGVTGKYITSTLIESAKATAYAADFGLQMPINSRVRIGGAVQNFGTKMTYLNEGDNLPRIVRGGMSVMLFPGRYQTSLLLEAPYFVNEQELRPSLGVETTVGPLALRAGYRTGNALQEFSVGTGFVFGNSSLDYSFGLVDQLNSQHRMSFSLKFGGSAASRQRLVKVPDQPLVLASAAKSTPNQPTHNVLQMSEPASVPVVPSEIYTIRSGDTLAKIAKKKYGDAKLWTKIYAANDHVLSSNPTDLNVGQKIALPR
jgi:LysM repeat protein